MLILATCLLTTKQSLPKFPAGQRGKTLWCPLFHTERDSEGPKLPLDIILSVDSQVNELFLYLSDTKDCCVDEED